MKLLQSQFDKNDNSVEALTARNQVLNKEIEAQQQKIDTLRAALNNAAESFGENDRRTQNWQIQLNNAEAALNSMERELSGNEQAIQGMTDEMDAAGDSTGDFADALEDSGDAAEDAGGKFEKFKSVLGTIGKTTAAAVTDIGTAAVAAGKAIWDMANETAAGDKIDKTSQKIGIIAEAYQEWAYVFERSGANVDNLQAGMKTLSGVVADAAAGSASAAEKLNAVGLSIEQLNGLSQEEQLNLVVSALQEMGSGAERTSAATDLLGKSAVDMAAVLNMIAEDTAALKKEAQDYGMVMSNETVAASAAFEDIIAHAGQYIAPVNDLHTEIPQGCFRGGQHRGSCGIIEIQLVRQHKKRPIAGIGTALKFTAKQGGIECAGCTGLGIVLFRQTVGSRQGDHRRIGGCSRRSRRRTGVVAGRQCQNEQQSHSDTKCLFHVSSPCIIKSSCS